MSKLVLRHRFVQVLRRRHTLTARLVDGGFGDSDIDDLTANESAPFLIVHRQLLDSALRQREMCKKPQRNPLGLSAHLAEMLRYSSDSPSNLRAWQ